MLDDCNEDKERQHKKNLKLEGEIKQLERRISQQNADISEQGRVMNIQEKHSDTLQEAIDNLQEQMQFLSERVKAESARYESQKNKNMRILLKYYNKKLPKSKQLTLDELKAKHEDMAIENELRRTDFSNTSDTDDDESDTEASFLVDFTRMNL
jgi:hypothetical protein